MEEQTIPTPQTGAAVDPIDEIANLLLEEPPVATPEKAEESPEGAKAEEPGPDDESDQQAEAEAPEKEEAATDDDDDRTLSELLGLDSNQVAVDEESGDLLISTKVDGAETQLNFKEVIAGYQTQKSNTQRSQALAKERATFEETALAKTNELQQALEVNHALTAHLQQELMGEYQRTDWNALREQDPAEYAARQQDMQGRYNQVQSLLAAVQTNKHKQTEQQDTETQQARVNHVENQRALMLDAIPEWRDPTAMKAGVAEIRTFLGDTYGFTQDELATVTDLKQINIIRDAMSFRKGQKIAEKKVVKVPKMQKSKGVKPNKLTKLDKLTKAAKNASGANRRDAEIDAVTELLLG